MMPSPWLAIGLILGVFILALLLRRPWGAKDELSGPLRPPPAPLAFDDEEPDLDEPEEDAKPDERVPVTAEGMALVRVGHQVALVPLVQSEEIPDWLRSGIEDSSVPYQIANKFAGQAAHGSHGARPGMMLSAGDFTAARIRRESGGWRVETLGRDGDFGFFPFETESGARQTLELLQQLGVVQVRFDEDERRIPPSPEDFEEARRRYEQTERDLALGDPGEGLPPGEYSDRR